MSVHLPSARHQIPWSRIAVEVVAIVFSVLLALALDAWWQQREQRDLAQTAQAHLRAEIEANRDAVLRVVAYHDSLATALRRSPDQTPVNLRPAFVRNSSWETAQSTGAATEMDYGVVAVVSDIAESQRQYQELVRTAIELLYLGNVQRPDASRRSGYAPLVEDLHAWEQSLLRKYERALQLLPPG